MAQYTEFLGITKLEPGQQQAHVVANEAFDNYDRAVAGLVEIDLSGKSACQLTAFESTHAVLRFTQADRACLVTIQAQPKTWTVLNDTAWTVSFRTGAGQTAVAVGAGQNANLVCDGEIIRRTDDPEAARNTLAGPRTYYVRKDGRDANDGLTPATALATADAAKVRLRLLKTNGYPVTLDLGEGVWPAISFQAGETGDADAVVISGAGSGLTTVAADNGSAIQILNNNTYFAIQNLGLSASANGLDVQNVKRLDARNLQFGLCGANHLNLHLTHCVLGSGLTIVGGAASFVYCATLTCLRSSQPITLTNTPRFTTAFTVCSTTAYSYWKGTTFSGAATGVRYRAEYLGFLSVAGGGANFFPGDQAGVTSTATGGYYV